MSFRTVIVRNRAKLDLQLNYMVYRGETNKKIHLSEISILIIESTAVALTAALLNELIKNKVKVIFCDQKHLPSCQLMPFYDNFHSSKQIDMQINWLSKTKKQVWTNIVKQKIINQAKVFDKYHLSNELLLFYANEIKEGDTSNREGHAAKVYFNHLFNELNRRCESVNNNALNYGYSILLSAFCREITSHGYLTQIGIWHRNEFNHYNLASDLMETYRVIVDDMVLSLGDLKDNYKIRLRNLLSTKVMIGGKLLYLDNAISVYVTSVFKALNTNNVSWILNFTEYELPLYENNDNV